MRKLLWAAVLLASPLLARALPVPQCIPVPHTPTEMHLECSSAGCVVFWPCQNADGTWGSYSAWGHMSELVANATKILSDSTNAALANLSALDTLIAAVPATTDDYSDLNPLLQDLIAKYQPANPPPVPVNTVAPSGSLTTRPVYLYNTATKGSTLYSTRVAVGAACSCATLQVGTSPKYCTVAGDKGADGSVLPANTIAICQ